MKFASEIKRLETKIKGKEQIIKENQEDIIKLKSAIENLKKLDEVQDAGNS